MVDVNQNDLVLGSGYLGYFLSRPGLKISLYNLFEPMLSISDNSATDIILSHIGGPFAVQNYLSSHHLDDIKISNYIEGLYEASNGLDVGELKKQPTLLQKKKHITKVPQKIKQQYHFNFYNSPDNTTTPYAMAYLMLKLYKKQLLDDLHRSYILNVMSNSTKSYIKKSLPTEVNVSSKTGSWWDISNNKSYNYIGEVGLMRMGNGDVVIFALYAKSNNSSQAKLQDALNEASLMILQNFYSSF